MNIIDVLILAIIEGVTEFLPISSTGHLIIASHFLGIKGNDFNKLFIIGIQFGAILSVIFVYRKKFFNITDYVFLLKLLCGVLPALVIGILFKEQIESFLDSALTVSITLILGGIVLIRVDKLFINNQKNNPTYKESFVIGLFQCIAMIPGISRSAATIIGGMSQGLTRKASAEFSFFLAVPTMFAASAYKLFDFYKTNNFNSETLQLFFLGFLVAFFVSLVTIKFFISFLQKNGFLLFGYYRIALGVILLLTL